MEKKDHRILFMSNAVFAPSGYGNQSEGMLYDWVKQGYNVRQLAHYGVQGRRIGLNGLMIYPALEGDIHGDKTSRLIFNNWKPHVYFTLYDIWMDAYTDPHPQNPNARIAIHPYWIPIVMVDHDPIPEGTERNARAAYKVICPTKWGTKQLEDKGIPTEYIPFGIDTEKWKPQTEDQKRESKKWLNERSVPMNQNNWKPIEEDSFLIVLNGANKDPYRKAFMRFFIALQLFLEQNPDARKDTRVYVHSWMRLARDIPHGAKTLNVEDVCKCSADYHMLCGVPTEALSRITGSGDVFAHPTQGGGFEIPVLEAMSCGVPPMASNFVGLPELIEGNGWKLPLVTRYFSPLDSTQGIVDEHKFAEAIEDAYNNPDKVKKLGEKAREKAVAEYDWSLVNPKYYQIIDELRDLQSYKPLEMRKL